MTNKTTVTSILVEFLTLYTKHFLLLFFLLLIEGLANKVYVMQSGKIIEEGSFIDLSHKREGYLFNLLKIQSAKK